MILQINGLGMQGGSPPMMVNVRKTWESYFRYFQRDIAQGRPARALPEFATWSVNGEPIETPTAFFLEISERD